MNSDDAVDFLVGDERALRANQFRRAGRQIQHVAFAEQFVRAHRVENRARVHPRRALERDARGDVCLDDAGDDVHARPLGGDDAMDARRARHLRDARDGHFHVGGRHEHQVRQFVNDDDDVAQPFGNDDVLLARHDDFLVHFDGESFRARLDLFPFGGERQFGFGLRQRLVFRARIERVDVADADARENLVALFHFIHDPAQREDDFLRVGHDRHDEVRQRVVLLQARRPWDQSSRTGAGRAKSGRAAT